MEAESSFIAELGPQSCSAGGINPSTTTLVPVAVSTVPQTVTGPIRPLPQSQSTIASPTITALPETISTSAASTTFTEVVPIANSTASLIVAGTATSIIVGSGPNATIIPFPGVGTAVIAPHSLFFALLLALPGVLAWAL